MTTHTVDNFVDTSGTALESHTPDSGGPWSNLGGDAGGLQISSTNKLSKVTTTHGAGIWAVDTGADDHYAKITINVGSSWPNSTVYLAVRVQDASNCYYFGHNSATGFFIRKFVAGSFTNLATFTSAIATGDVFKLDVVGNVLTAYRNGSPISGGSVTDTTGAGGGAQFPTGSKSGLIVVATASAPNMFTKFEADAIGGGGRTASVAITDPADTVSGNVDAIVTASVAVTDAADQVSGAAGVLVTASGAITDPADQIAGNATVADHRTISGAITDPADQISGVGSVSISAQIAIIEPVDVISGTVVSGSGPAANDDLVVPLVRRRRR